MSVEEILELKQKLAQCVAVIGRKDREIGELREKIVGVEELCSSHSGKCDELLRVVEHSNRQIVEEQALIKQLQERISQNRQDIDVFKLDK